mgnify:FL=1
MPKGPLIKSKALTHITEAIAYPPPKYSAYRFEAVIDWIEIKIVLTNASNFDTVRKRLGVPHVEPLNRGAGGAATEFVFKVHDLTSWKDLDKQLARLTHDHPLACPPEVIGIEIAFDAYFVQESRAALVSMASRFYKFSSFVTSHKRRLAGAVKGTGKALVNVTDVNLGLDTGLNIYIGDRGSDLEQHIYVKVTDNNKRPIPVKKHRARSEVTLRGAFLPHMSLDEWRKHNFTKEAKFFKYRELKEDLSPVVESSVSHIAQVGERRARNRRDGGTRVHSPSTVADAELNAIAYEALRKLTRHMKA